ncbi:gamma-glutamylcyclotransferase [Pseudanabaena sp. FACHB-1998]|uniref:gamma-glutamylcyclotransferase n=1 Tax=Pseudanabaena sp. FACHB-1998 TaxID=2692858 RepID=UPI0016806A91|nr:gamma-glutamylcyclotransferase [Pseudanabaena sp. FACHB-1998]
MESTDSCQVFVYGTLKPNEANYAKYCEGKILTQQPAIAYGKLFALPMGYPAMIQGDREVQGYLFSFEDDHIFESLDELEDYQSDRHFSENLYTRQRIEIFDLERISLGWAWTYLMTLEQVSKFGGIYLENGLWVAVSKPFPLKK